MIYLTIRQKQQECQLTFEDILFNKTPTNLLVNNVGKAGTLTRKVEKISSKVMKLVNIKQMIDAFHEFNCKYSNLLVQEKETMYRTFYIPKRSGGLRRIDAPNDELMGALRELKLILEQKCGALYHTSAFAYVPNRCIVDAVTKHKLNESNWFLKVDFSNFFPSITMEYTLRMLSIIFPFSEIIKNETGKIELEKALSLGFLNGGLPQGTPLSPMLSNLVNIPFDHTIFNYLANKQFVYTRYADDILISCQQYFDYKSIIKVIKITLKEFNAPFNIKDQKTRYGSRKGTNWNLGLMLNKDNNITVGHIKKKYFKAALNNFIQDTLHNKPWSLEDIQQLQGTISYYKMIEKDYFNYLINHYNQKYRVNVEQMIKNQISNF